MRDILSGWCAVVVVSGIIAASVCYGELDPCFYEESCPDLYSIVRRVVNDASDSDPRIGASLIRLHFHDCFVQGCDGSVLLNKTDTIDSEQDSRGNTNSIRGLNVVNDIKTAVEDECPNTVSCADILAIAAQVSVVLNDGPWWEIPLGRRDSTRANRSLADANLPAPFLTLDQLKQAFANQGLNTTDLVALSGAHTFGRANCTKFNTRLYDFNSTGSPDPTLNTTYLEALRIICPQNVSGASSNLTNLDLTTPDKFDKNYYTNLLLQNGLLQTDQELFSTSGADTVDIVNSFAADQDAFFDSFAASMIKMGNINPLTGDQGEIRTQCNFLNNAPSSSPSSFGLSTEHSHHYLLRSSM